MPKKYKFRRLRKGRRTVGGMKTHTATLESSVYVPPRLKIELPYNPAIALLGTYPKDIKILI